MYNYPSNCDETSPWDGVNKAFKCYIQNIINYLIGVTVPFGYANLIQAFGKVLYITSIFQSEMDFDSVDFY